MASTIVDERFKKFVKTFVAIFEIRLEEYFRRIEENIEKSGTFATYFKTIVDLGKNANNFFGVVGKTASAISCDVVVKVINDFSVRYNRNEVKKLLQHLYLFKEDSDGVREKLVESACRIFQSFEYQFVHVTANQSWERAMSKLAEDAVGRVINYFRANPDLVFSSDTIVEGVIFGKSKAFRKFKLFSLCLQHGRTVQYDLLGVNWNTAKMFSNVGVFDEGNYYRKIYETGGTVTFGYRLRLQENELKDYCKEEFVVNQHSHEYILNRDKDIKTKIQELLLSIDKSDKNWKKIEERIKKDICDEVKEDLNNLESVIKNNINELHKFIENNQNEIRKYFAILLNRIDGIESSLIELYITQQTTNTKLDEANVKLDKIMNVKEKLDPNQIEPFKFGIIPKLRFYANRTVELNEIHEKLQQNVIVVICGLGGVGKSELARLYVYEYVDKNFFKIQIDSSSGPAAELAFRRVYKKLGLKIEDEVETIETVIEEVYACIGKRSIFIFDNAENYATVEKFLPLTTSYTPLILITSPNVSEKEWHTMLDIKIELLHLKGFTNDAAKKFVKDSLKMKGNIEDEYVEELIGKLYNFPLALNQAVAFIEGKRYDLKNSKIKRTLSHYLPKYDQNPKIFLDYRIDNNMKTITTLKITIGKLDNDAEYGKKAADMLNMLSYFMPNNIPENIFLTELAQGDEDIMTDITNLLKKYAILHLNDEMIDVHGLVQTVIRLELKKQPTELKCLKRVFDILLNYQHVQICSCHITSAWTYSSEHEDLRTYVTTTYPNHASFELFR